MRGRSSAAVRLGRVRRQLGCREDRAEEKPAAELARHQDGVLALPAEARGLRQGLLHHGGGVDEDLHVLARTRRQEARELLELALDDVVVVAHAGVDRDGAAVFQRERGERVGLRPVAHAEDDDALRLGPERVRSGAARGRLGHPRHLAVMPFREPGLEALADLGRRLRGRDAHHVEAERLRPRLDLPLEFGAAQKSRSA
jgi:hypothetical protein